MACSHLGGGHHSGDHHSSIRQPSYQYSTHKGATSGAIEGFLMRQNSRMAQEGTEAQSEGEKGG